jgi:hypothetical protein
MQDTRDVDGPTGTMEEHAPKGYARLNLTTSGKLPLPAVLGSRAGYDNC